MNKKTLKVIVSSLIVLESIFVFLACASFFNKDISDIDKLNIPDEVKKLIKTKIQVCKDDKES